MNQIKMGKFISELRKEKNMTQDEFAIKFAVNNKMVSRIETGAQAPDISLLEPIAKEFNITIEELLNSKRKNKLNNNSAKLKEMIIEIKKKLESEKKKPKKKLTFENAKLPSLVSWFETSISETDAKISMLNTDISSVTIEGKLNNIKMIELERNMIIFLEIADETGSIISILCARLDEGKEFIKKIQKNQIYRFKGNVAFDEELHKEHILFLSGIDGIFLN